MRLVYISLSLSLPLCTISIVCFDGSSMHVIMHILKKKKSRILYSFWVLLHELINKALLTVNVVVIYRVMNSQGVSEIRLHSVIKSASFKKSSQKAKIFHKNNLNIHRGLKIYLNVELELYTHTTKTR